jgi:hypothetical protein
MSMEHLVVLSRSIYLFFGSVFLIGRAWQKYLGRPAQRKELFSFTVKFSSNPSPIF